MMTPRPFFSPTRIVLLLAVAVLVVAGALLLAEAATASTGAGGGLERIAFALAAVSAVVALSGAWLLSRELQRRHGVEEEMRASRAKFEGILAIAVDAIISVDEQQQILHFNYGAARLFGYAEAEVVGTPLSRLLPNRFRDAHAQHLHDFAAGPDVARRMGERRAIYGLRRDGTEFPAEASISRLELPGRQVFTVVLRDISERLRSAENQRFLAHARGMLATTLDYESTLQSVVHLAVPYLADCCLLDVTDANGLTRTIASVHDDPEHTKRLRAFEQRRGEARHWPFSVADVLEQQQHVMRTGLEPGWEAEGADDDARASALAQCGITAFMTLPLVARDGVLGTLTLLSNQPRRPYDDIDVAVAEDLAPSMAFAVENAWLYQLSQQASRARDEILGVVSHDLRNPLSAISMCARVLLESPPEVADDRRELADAILQSTHLMQRLIQDLLDASTIESGHLQIHRRAEALGPLVDSALNMVRLAADERGIALVRDVAPALPAVFIDAMRLEQVLANLLGNAVKFTEHGGRVSVQVDLDGAVVRVRVSDSGVGIPAEHLPHIFDRYWHARRQSRTAGTGLGLAIARGIVEAHGGTLGVESSLGTGSTFTFTVPAVDGSAGIAPARHGGAAGVAEHRIEASTLEG